VEEKKSGNPLLFKLKIMTHFKTYSKIKSIIRLNNDSVGMIAHKYLTTKELIR
jgi:hypothetical protein